ncbi:MAG: hypothetical protein J3Q66DRAFT_350467 [Benniella sp.]|nr:MAG: hypothetical protein J3Q66DRAFT_350467 [Benniella sp.]
MFNLPEIDDLVFRQLRQHELALCARVSRMWHRIVIPYLWGDLTYLSESAIYPSNVPDTMRRAFGMMVLDDYLLKTQHGKVQEEGHAMEKHVQAQPSILGKHGPFIRVLPDPRGLLFYLPIRCNQPTTYQLLLHLFEYCPLAHVQYLEVEYDDLEPDDRWTRIVEVVLPRVRHLHVLADSVSRPSLSSFPRLEDMLDKCSNALTKLELTVQVPFVDEEVDDGKAGHLENGLKEWTSLKELCLFWCHEKSISKTFWPWLWKRCSRIEKLHVDALDRFILQSLPVSMSTTMFNLDKICLGAGYMIGQHLTDNVVAALLSGSRKGWKVVQAGSSSEFGNDAVEALTKHVSTLEELSVGMCHGPTGNDLVQILASAPRLHTFGFCGERSTGNMYPCFSADKFVDRDPSTGSLATWACETSLKVLIAKIRGIPRPDLSGQNEDTQSSQGQAIQTLVHDRLARLIHLETLWLGNRPDESLQNRNEQCDCLEMSLESGLYKLTGLKRLKELIVSGMKTKIGVKEVQWMATHWPRLRVIHGLERDKEEGKKAVEWLQEHHPEIRLQLPPLGPFT